MSKRDKRVSAYLITINTNQRPKEADMEDYANEFKGHIDNLFGKKNNYKEEFGLVDYFDGDGSNKLDNIKVKSVIELGETPTSGRIHAHVILKIHHRTKIRKINKKAIYQYFEDKMNIQTHVNVKFVPANLATAKLYVEKTIDEQPKKKKEKKKKKITNK